MCKIEASETETPGMATADAIRLAALEAAAQMSVAEPMAHAGRIEAAIRSAVAAERERCATIAETFADQAIKDRDGFGASYCNDIAAAIRIVANKKE